MIKDNASVVKSQFNQQAPLFDQWSVTRDEQHAKYIVELAGIGKRDKVLDVACGTGAFANCVAKSALHVVGVDISENMIEHAKKQANLQGLSNVEFVCSDVSKLPFTDGTFSVAGSKSAFHHMPKYQTVFYEMVRSTQDGGKICLQDIMAYDDKYVNDYFEELEMLVDASHFNSFSKDEFVALYKTNNVAVSRKFESISNLNMYDYIGHAVQSTENKEKIKLLLDRARRDAKIKAWLIEDGEKLVWRRPVITIMGKVSK
jgi:ubiquinone/menaquinone biosynthesis C-methylase UbiE